MRTGVSAKRDVLEPTSLRDGSSCQARVDASEFGQGVQRCDFFADISCAGLLNDVRACCDDRRGRRKDACELFGRRAGYVEVQSHGSRLAQSPSFDARQTLDSRQFGAPRTWQLMQIPEHEPKFPLQRLRCTGTGCARRPSTHSI